MLSTCDLCAGRWIFPVALLPTSAPCSCEQPPPEEGLPTRPSWARPRYHPGRSCWKWINSMAFPGSSLRPVRMLDARTSGWLTRRVCFQARQQHLSSKLRSRMSATWRSALPKQHFPAVQLKHGPDPFAPLEPLSQGKGKAFPCFSTPAAMHKHLPTGLAAILWLPLLRSSLVAISCFPGFWFLF